METGLFRLNDFLKGLWMNAMQESGEGRNAGHSTLGEPMSKAEMEIGMIEELTKRYFAKLPELRSKFTEKHPEDYKEVVRAVVDVLTTDAYRDMDPERIHEIDDGDYQGTMVYVIGAKGYQPNDYWYCKVSYGSCSGCDTLQSISCYSSDAPTDSQVSEYMTLALHVVQGIKKMGDSDA